MADSDAVKYLTRFIRERYIDGIGIDRDVSKADELVENGAFIEAGWPVRQRLCKHESDPEEPPEEMVFKIYGLASNTDRLLPFDISKDLKRDGLRKLLNAITIVGMGNEEFAGALAGIQEIHRVAQNTWPGRVEDYHPDMWMGYPAITIANPVFSPKPGDLDIASVGFLPGEDPKGSLADALRTHSSHIRHLDENVVHYLFVKNRNTKPDYIKSTEIKKGQAVEVDFTVSLIPLPNNKLKMVLVLRQITIYSNRRVAMIEVPSIMNINIAAPQHKWKYGIKRRIGPGSFPTDGEEPPSKKLRHLSIDQRSNTPSSSSELNIRVGGLNINDSPSASRTPSPGLAASDISRDGTGSPTMPTPEREDQLPNV